MSGPPPPVVLLHGFGQNRRCWGPLRTALEHSVLERGARSADGVTALDLPGHGGSGAVLADPWTIADLVAGGIDDTAPAALIGYSMGGRMALHTALAHPGVVDRLVLISATAGIDDPVERDARRAADDALADHIEEVGVGVFVDEWLALPLFAGLPAAGRFVDERRTNSAAGLASSLRLAGAGAQDPLWDRLGELTMPTLIIAGERDTKFVALAERLAGGIGANATLAVVGSAGHTVHLEQPALTCDLITTWLASPRRSGRPTSSAAPRR